MTQHLPITNPPSLEETLQSAEQHCQRSGSKLTKKRKQLLSLLLQAHKAISAYELIELFSEEFKQTIPAMSVYRILDYFVGIGLIHKVNAVNKFVACSQIHNIENHGCTKLLFCQQCQQVQETPLNTSIYKTLLDEVTQSGSQLCSQPIELSCICNTCTEDSQLFSSPISALKQGATNER